jgi:membrane protein DedA with SNARE-associated domain
MTSVIEQFGALGVFLLMVPESACIPVPSEVTLLFAGFAVGEGWMSFPLAVLAATAGNLVGSLLAYGVGASGLVERVPGMRTLMDRSRAPLERYGPLRAVFLARLLPLARTFVSLPAGAQGVPLGPFVALTTAGCALWALAFVLVGLLAGTAWSAVGGDVGWGLAVVGVVAVAAALWNGGRARQR